MEPILNYYSLIEQPPKRFGAIMEEIAKDVFGLDDRVNTYLARSYI